jgi:hypothetical protein
LPISETATPSTPKGPTEIVRVDGVSFRLEQATRPDSFWIVQGDDQRLAVLLQRRDTTWVVFELDRNTGGFRGGDDYYSAHTREDAVRYSCLYTMCYRLRRRRELAWFTSTIATLLQQGINITSPAPLETLCGISIPKVGWHVFRRTRGDHWDKFLCVYSGDSETEARWEYAIAKPDAEIAAALINPLNQVIDDRVDTKRS